MYSDSTIEAHQGRIMGQSVTSPPGLDPLCGRPPPPSFSQPISLSAFGLWYVLCGVKESRQASPLTQILCKSSQSRHLPCVGQGFDGWPANEVR